MLIPDKKNIIRVRNMIDLSKTDKLQGNFYSLYLISFNTLKLHQKVVSYCHSVVDDLQQVKEVESKQHKIVLFEEFLLLAIFHHI